MQIINNPQAEFFFLTVNTRAFLLLDSWDAFLCCWQECCLGASDFSNSGERKVQTQVGKHHHHLSLLIFYL